MTDPFKIDGPTCLSLSGGRTSAYMLRRVLDANPSAVESGDLAIVFANTGREAPETLDFVREVGRQWEVPVAWVEFCTWNDGAGYRQVFYATASRHGEPYEALVRMKKFLPNAVARFCTVALKIKPTELYLQANGWTEWDNMLGFRADEPLRVAKVRAAPILPESPGVERCVPLAAAGITKAHIRDFWNAQPFDLALPMNYDGTTMGGNCDGCFLKSPHEHVARAQRDPEFPVFWIRQEEFTGATFYKDGTSFRQIAEYARTQNNIFDPNEEAIACFCGD